MPITRLRHRRRAVVVVVTLVATAALALTGCSSSSTPSAATSNLKIGSLDLSKVCPSTIVYQDSWYPQAEQGYMFQMLGKGYTIDSGQKSITGPLMADGEYTGVSLQIRSGGPAIANQTPVSQMYTDNSITFGSVESDEAVELSQKFPTIGVFTPLDKSPLMVMWDPATYPNVTDIKQLGSALATKGGVMLYSQGTSYVDYLTSSGQLSKKVIDGSYKGVPANFIAAAGKDAQQGYATNEAYLYPHALPQWDKPIKYELLADAGWDPYPDALAIRSADLQKLTPCLQKLIPVMQKADVDYFASPTKANGIILQLVAAYKTGAPYTKAVVDAADTTMIGQKLASNAGNSTIGDFDLDRLQKFFDTSIPIFTAGGNPPAKGLTPSTMYTNKFIDKSIGLPQ